MLAERLKAAAPYLIEIGGHSEALQQLETIYLRCLAFAALPMLVMGAINGFLPTLDKMMTSGLITLEKVQVLQYGSKAAS